MDDHLPGNKVDKITQRIYNDNYYYALYSLINFSDKTVTHLKEAFWSLHVAHTAFEQYRVDLKRVHRCSNRESDAAILASQRRHVAVIVENKTTELLRAVDQFNLRIIKIKRLRVELEELSLACSELDDYKMERNGLDIRDEYLAKKKIFLAKGTEKVFFTGRTLFLGCNTKVPHEIAAFLEELPDDTVERSSRRNSV